MYVLPFFGGVGFLEESEIKGCCHVMSCIFCALFGSALQDGKEHEHYIKLS